MEGQSKTGNNDEKAQLGFASAFNSNLSFHTSWVGGGQGSDWRSKVPSTVRTKSCSWLPEETEQK